MHLPRFRPAAAVAAVSLLTAVPSCAAVKATSPPAGPTHPTVLVPRPGSVPRADHVVLVIFENERASQVIGNAAAPYINSLADSGANFTQSYAVTHPSQPNYIALFSGSTQGVTDDECTYSFDGNNQAHQLIAAGFTFASYSEGVPWSGSNVCKSGGYARKHAPWASFTNVPEQVQRSFTAFPSDYTKLPDVSWVVPNLCNDMHDCSVATGDQWLKAQLGDYARWAQDHSSLLIVTFDEDDRSGDNRIATIFRGADVRPGTYNERITHYNVLATLEDMYGLERLGNARTALPITDVWK